MPRKVRPKFDRTSGPPGKLTVLLDSTTIDTFRKVTMLSGTTMSSVIENAVKKYIATTAK